MKFSKSSKEYDIQDRLKHRGIFCISKNWIKWAKKYSSRASRRKDKLKLKIYGGELTNIWVEEVTKLDKEE